jgi:two-component system, sensor histidine kinase RpfC
MRDIEKSEDVQLLVADDDQWIRDLLVRILQDAKYRVKAVATGEAALDALLQHDFDCAIVDVQMPRLGAIEVLTRYRSQKPGRTKIVVLTADASPTTTVNCLQAGADLVLTKPVRRLDLLKAVEQLLAQKPSVPSCASEAQTGELDGQILDSLYRAVGDKHFVRGLLRRFAAQAREIVGQIDDASTKEQLHQIDDLAHKLEGSAGSVGASAIVIACRELRRVGMRMLSREERTRLIASLRLAVDDTVKTIDANG